MSLHIQTSSSNTLEGEHGYHDSEQRYRLLFNSISNPVFVHQVGTDQSHSSRFIEVNDAACQHLGYTRDELLKMGPAEITDPEDHGANSKLLGPFERGAPVVRRSVHLTKDGRKIPVEITQRMFQMNGNATCLSTAKDISKRREAETSLRSSRKRLLDILEGTPAGYFFIDQDGRYRHVNHAWLGMHGFSTPEEVIGSHFSLTQPEADLEAAKEMVSRVLAGEHIQSGEFSRRLRDGTTAYHTLSARPVIEGGQTLGLEGFLIDITTRKFAEAAMQRSKIELEAIYDSTPLMMCLINRQREVEHMNRSLAEFVGDGTPDRPQKPGDVLGCIHALDDPRGCGFGDHCHACPLRLALNKTFETGQPCRQVEAAMFLARGGVRRQIRVSGSSALVMLPDGPRVLVCLEDITAAKQLEAQFLQAQKMEAIGQLAGGVAHDFNNILSAALLHLELLQQTQNLAPGMAASLRELGQGVQRAASLTRQLLLFSRRQVMQTSRVDLNEVVKALMKMLKRLLGEHLETTLNLDTKPVWLEGDVGMLEQVVMNLCVNARDAMPRGGHLTLSTRRVTLTSENVVDHPGSRAGEFACFTATDTGCGMDETTLKRIFEPFFTTKEAGKGTGLGLATVHGIVKQHQGWIEVESAVGSGSTFRVFLPAASAPVSALPVVSETEALRGSETILLVEDEDPVRRMLRTSLRLFGYDVIEACNGAEAMKLWENACTRVSLVFTDMVMPGGFTGLDLAEKLREFKPELKVVISSGYSADLLEQGGQLAQGIKFLAKPFGPKTLAKIVRDCLDGK